MMLRLLFVLLCALNIAVAAWVWLGQPYAVDARPASDAGVATLQLLSELPPVALAAAPTAAPATPTRNDPATSSELRCLALGAFATPQDMRTARQLLATQTTRTRARQEMVTRTGSWWVYLPPAANRTQALASVRRLAARDIGDYFVVSSGSKANSVSLGVFREPANARRRRDEVVAAGFPARMEERMERAPEYWLDMVVAAGTRLDWSAVSTPSVRAHSIACF